MSSGREFQSTDAATGNERRPTVDRRNDGTRSEWWTMTEVGDDQVGFVPEPFRNLAFLERVNVIATPSPG